MTPRNTLLITHDTIPEAEVTEMEVGGEIVAMKTKASDLKVQVVLVEAGAITVGKVGAIMVKDEVAGECLPATGAIRLGTKLLIA